MMNIAHDKSHECINEQRRKNVRLQLTENLDCDWTTFIHIT